MIHLIFIFTFKFVFVVHSAVDMGIQSEAPIIIIYSFDIISSVAGWNRVEPQII